MFSQKPAPLALQQTAAGWTSAAKLTLSVPRGTARASRPTWYSGLHAALAVVIAISGCAPAGPTSSDTSAEEATLKGLSSLWFDAYNAGDVDRMVALYAEDAVLMPLHAPVARGHDRIRSHLHAELAAAAAAGIQLVPGPATAGVDGDIGWESGSFSVVDSASKALDTGSYLSVARKVDGRWLLIRDIYNSDRPLAASQSRP